MPFIVSPRQFTQRAEFYRQLAQLTAAGIGVTHALEQLKSHPPAHSYRVPIQKVLEKLMQGQTLSESLHYDNWLPDFDVTIIAAGERSGRLDSCFRMLSDYYSQRASLTKQIISRLIYPAFLIHFAAFVFLVVLPFAGSQFHASLSLLFIKAVLTLLPIYLLVGLIIFVSQSKHGEKWRAVMESVLNPVPMLGSGRRALALARLAAVLEALISAGVNIVEAWNFAAIASNSPALRRTVSGWKSSLAAGRTPAELVGSSSIFPTTFANLYHSGEVSGKLDETLRRLHIFYEEEGSYKIQIMAQWTTYAIYLLAVLAIAYKIIQFYTGYFNQVSNVMNGF
ncbi:MAG TPA: type II secretion system F family protein [Verrucomicrobiae bacterium]|nr:type II secretion system F family protein [Verrucomicrobiae bacterium]